MKVDAKQLFEVVRQVVVDEVKKQLPALIKTHLSEMYVKKALAEIADISPATEDRQRTVVRNDIVESLDARAPKIMNPREVVSKLLSRENPMSFIYENVKLPEETADDPGIPLKQDSSTFAVANRMIEAMENNAKKNVIVESPAAKLAELERRRKALDVPAT